MADTIPGIHHITSISSDPQRNLDFYTEVLGLRLIKVTVNFDVPGTYHFYYGDEVGTPGTILTIFPWPHLSRRPPGTGQVVVTSFAIPSGSTGYWVDRLTSHGVTVERPAARHDEEVIAFTDHDGLQYELVTRDDGPAQSVWAGGPVPAEHAIRGFHGATIWVTTLEPTARLLTDLMEFRLVSEENDRLRFEVGEGASRAVIDVASRPSAPRGEEGTGTVHHIAWRTPNDATQGAWRERLVDAGFRVTPVRDRQYFRSIYFREPGGVLFEIATDGPGFTVDEPVEELGTSLKLPPWYEPRRAEIEQALPPLDRLTRSGG
ncbi:MAG: ring-cleaving dioxygenase [Sphaerobacter thermophilus]|uniref:ring-cleaving dioxygenase n=1 Tax=Sphaerobacter thermophilus TaxID=2057 RepID=UPI000DB3F9CF|nr:MAG: ring-cleaving dioxygenase [Sphaerobacter thermophilus]